MPPLLIIDAAAICNMQQAVLQHLQSSLDGMRRDLRWLVELESPSDEPAALAHAAHEIRDWAERLTGSQAEIIEDEQGPHLILRTTGDKHGYILLLGHLDTVWPLGTLRTRPYLERGEIATGPGVFDMKAGLVQAMWGISALRQLHGHLPDVVFLINSDEEMLSHRSRNLVESLAKDASLALVLEPSADGAVKTSRKGVGRFTIVIHGRAAHAGVDPWRGVNALEELSRLILQVSGLNASEVGTTANVGLARGGSRPNVVPEWAEAVVDVRVPTQAEAARVESVIRGLRPAREGATVTVEGGIARPPMERTPSVGRLFEVAQAVAARLGLDLAEAASGGASDGNLCAALGVPVLDGLGAVGGGAHAPDEYVRVADMPLRAALVANLLVELGSRASEVA